ncbi:MAG TPA: hypothetical protein PLI09_28445 [Candidatus Hydrogenedentes bacterium]|nr:hypothetical protein [Candidatus Hydrogenedentota bacterium]
MDGELMEIRYRFAGKDGEVYEFLVRLDARTLDHIFDPPNPSPEWTRLTMEQCVGCPLDASLRVRCPLALSLVELVEKAGTILSYAEMDVTVDTPQRTMSRHTSAQKGVSSLLGLLMATSGCPNTAFLKPMARFHLPFATREETIFRSAGAYLLAQFFLYQRGKKQDMDLRGLQAAYARVQAVNVGMAHRLRHVSEGDANVNAIALLDLFAQDLPFAIDEKLGELEYLFAPYFTTGQ